MNDPKDGMHVVPVDEVHMRVQGVEGWLTDAQVDRLHRVAAATPVAGQIVEIGSFRGRSTIVLASAAPAGVMIDAIDPHAGNDRGPREIGGYEAEAAEDNEVFEANLRAVGVRDRVRHHRLFSDVAHGSVDGPIDVLFIDGAHRFGPARADIRDWGARVAPDGTMLIHDAFSSVGVTGAIVVELLGSSEWRYVGRSGSLAEYQRAEQSLVRTLADAARQGLQLGWFVRNVLIKVLIVAKMRRVARVLGHRQDAFPY